jgi:hypothetical protein
MTIDELNQEKSSLPAGTEVTVTVYRSDDEMNYTLGFELEDAE